MPVMSGGEAMAKSLIKEGVERRIRDTGHTGVRDNRRFTRRAGHPHDYHPPRTGRHLHGRRLRSRLRKTGRSPGGSRRGPLAAAGLTTAYSRSSPVLVIAGQIPRGAIGRNLGAVHEIADQPGTVRSVTKWQRLALRPREVPDAVFEAFRQMRTGRPVPCSSSSSPRPAWSAKRSDCAIPLPSQE